MSWIEKKYNILFFPSNQSIERVPEGEEERKKNHFIKGMCSATDISVCSCKLN